MSSQTTPTQADQLEVCDDEFGDSPSYWYGLMSMSFQNQRFCESIIDRAICFGMRRRNKIVKNRKKKKVNAESQRNENNFR